MPICQQKKCKKGTILGMQLLPNQEKIYRDIIAKVGVKNIVITGPSGCGKTELLKVLYTKAGYMGYFPVFLDSGKMISVDQYYPFLSGLNEQISNPSLTQVTSSLSQDSPILPHTIELLQRWLFGRAKKDLFFLNETEKEIFDRLSFLSNKKRLLALCDNIQYWDSFSLKFLNLMLQDYHLHNVIQNITFVCCYTTDQAIPNQDLLDFLWIKDQFIEIRFDEISYSTFVNNLHYLGLQKDLKRDEFEILYHMIGNHIQLMIEIIKEIDEDSLNFDKVYQSNIDFLKPILTKRLKQLGMLGGFIDESLKYAALLGIKFNKIEFTQIIEKNVNTSLDVYSALKEAEDIYLIKEQDQMNYAFVHEIIMKVFEAKISDVDKSLYYLKLAKCIGNLKPHDYLRRAYCFVNAHKNSDAERIFCLYLVQQFKEESELGETTYNELKSHINVLESYMTSMMQAYNQYHKKDYIGTYFILFGIPDIYTNDLLAEKYILVSCCQTKSLEISTKREAIDCLLKYADLEKVNREIDIYENVLERLIISYIHFGDLKKAREYEEKFVLSIAKRTEYDTYAKYRLYKLYRKSNAIYGAELAMVRVNQSVSFFAVDHIASNVKDFYIALTNASCVLLENGKFDKAYNTALNGINLEKEYPHLSFPRTQIIRSNLCIAGILTNMIKLQEGIEIIENILKDIPIIPERIFHIVNLTSLYAMNGNVTMALEILEQEAKKQNYQNDVEILYKYYICFNRSVFRFLLNKTEFMEESKKELTDIQAQLATILDGTYLVEKNKLFIQMIQSKTTKLNYFPNEWLYIFYDQKSIYKTRPLWKFHGLGYAFVTMNNWE